jgi:Cu(I)/Ag(I) efflux system membrane protein CusA/SilA
MLGGMVSTTLLTLIVIPAIYFIWVGRRLPKSPKPTHANLEGETA